MAINSAGYTDKLNTYLQTKGEKNDFSTPAMPVNKQIQLLQSYYKCRNASDFSMPFLAK